MKTTIGYLAPRYRAKLDAWAEDKRGTAAIEFAMIALPFFLLLFGLFEVCAVFIMSSILEHGINEASRDIRTGNLQENGFGAVAFKNAVCGELFGMLQCDGKLRIDVQTFSDFASGSAANLTDDPIDGSGEFDDSGFDFKPGDANEIVVVRAFYEWKLFTPVLSNALSNMSDNRLLLRSTVAFRNEPFGD